MRKVSYSIMEIEIINSEIIVHIKLVRYQFNLKYNKKLF